MLTGLYITMWYWSGIFGYLGARATFSCIRQEPMTKGSVILCSVFGPLFSVMVWMSAFVYSIFYKRGTKGETSLDSFVEWWEKPW